MRNIRQLLVAFLMSAVVACGGGGTLDSNGGTPEPAKYSAVIKLLTASGSESVNLSQATPLTIEISITSSNGGSLADKLIPFELNDAEVAKFATGTASAITNANGVARLGMTVGTKSGGATITATLPDGTKVSRSFNSAGDGAPVNNDPVASVLLLADKLELGTGNTDKIDLTALVRDKTSNVLSGITVKFAIEAGSDGELEVISAVSDRSGVAKATLTSKSNPALRTIEVTAAAGATAKSTKLTINVVGTSIEGTVPGAVVLGSTTDLSFTLQDSAGAPIKSVPLNVRSALGNSFNITTPVTDAVTGRTAVKYTAAISGNDVVSVTALGVTRSFGVSVNADAFGFIGGVGVTQEIPLNTVAANSLRWTRNNSPVANQPLTVATTRGVVSANNNVGNNVVTNLTTSDSGEATAYVSSTFAGLASLSATTQGAGVSLQSQKLVEFVATVPDASRPLEVQVIPAQLAPGEKAVVQAIVRDARNNPVKNKDVAFSLVDSFGGQISPAVARTNSLGVATSEFIADTITPGGGTAGQPKGLKIKATVVENQAVTGTTSVAVGSRTLFYRFGTGDSVRVSPDGTSYLVDYAVVVTDASGNPVVNQSLTVAVVPQLYRKGRWIKTPVGEAFKVWETRFSTSDSDPTCQYEDVNRNGVLDLGEDTNGDGTITPGNVVTVQRNITSNSNGIATFTLVYPKEFAAFVVVDVTLSGAAAGTENVFSRSFTLKVLSDDTIVETKRPPDSPWGIDADLDEATGQYRALTRCGI